MKRIIHKVAGRRRAIAWVSSLLLATIVVLAVGWYFALPQYRPALKPGEVYGIDVSSHQKDIDWTKVADDHISFVYVKATEGSGTQDSSYKDYSSGAQKAGLQTGAYHYFSLCSSGKTQATNFLSMTNLNNDLLPPALDLEFSPFCKEEPKRDIVIKEISAFVEAVNAQSGKKTLLYVGDRFDKTYQVKEAFKDAHYWQLRYMQRPQNPTISLWQAGNFFHVNGVQGKVDLDIGRISDL